MTTSPALIIPTPIDKPPIGSGGEHRSFEKQQDLDRKHLSKYIDARISRDGEWGDLSRAKRRAVVLDERERLLCKRARTRAGTTRSHYPSRHDEGVEREWVLEYFRREIGADKAKRRGDEKRGGKGDGGGLDGKDEEVEG